MSDEYVKQKHAKRRKRNMLAKELRDKKYQQRVVRPKFEEPPNLKLSDMRNYSDD